MLIFEKFSGGRREIFRKANKIVGMSNAFKDLVKMCEK